MGNKTRILIAGIAGASLGTEVAKCLSETNKYIIYGCDIAKLAYGNFMPIFEKTFLINHDDYINSIIGYCIEYDIKYIIPGGEKPMQILADCEETLLLNGIVLVSNSTSVIGICSDKGKTFQKLADLGFSIPLTIEVYESSDLSGIQFPCIVKPTTGTGGSDSVFLAASKEECLLYAELLKRNGRRLIVQEYIPEDDGEYTIGVLSYSDKKIAGVIGMRRIFNSKLSIAYKGENGLISSGYSQGLIKRFPKLEEQAISIAKAFGSKGPMNIQGRVKDGVLYPFEINPRFSASTYLRAKAGFNEIDIYMDHLITGNEGHAYEIKEGHYLRSFEEAYVPLDVKG